MTREEYGEIHNKLVVEFKKIKEFEPLYKTDIVVWNTKRRKFFLKKLSNEALKHAIEHKDSDSDYSYVDTWREMCIKELNDRVAERILLDDDDD